MTDSPSTAIPEAAKATSTANPPVQDIQMALEAESDRTSMLGERTVRAIEDGSTETPLERFAGALGQMSGASQVGMMRQLQRSYGNSYVGRVIQAKLTVGQPGDKYEEEADRVADTVMRMSEPGVTVEAEANKRVQPLQIQRMHTEFVKEEGEIYPKESPGQTPTVTSALEARLNATSGGGEALPESVRGVMEPRFGADFSGVRVHRGSEADALNRELGAQAFTRQGDIYFGAGRYKPETRDGQWLLAHELVHVVQQQRAPAGGPTISRRPQLDVKGGFEKSGGAGPTPPAHQRTEKKIAAEHSLIEESFDLSTDTEEFGQSLNRKKLLYSRTVRVQLSGEFLAVMRIEGKLIVPFMVDDPNPADLISIPGRGQYDAFVSVIDQCGPMRVWSGFEFSYRTFGGYSPENDFVSLGTMAARGPDYVHFDLAPEVQIDTLVAEVRRRLPPPRVPKAEDFTEEEFQRMTPNERRDLAWRALKDEFSVSNVARNVAITAGVMVLGALAIATGSTVLLGAAIAVAVGGGALIIYDTINDVADRWKDGDHVGAVLSLLKGLAYLGGLVAAVLGAPVPALGLVVGAIGIGIYLAHRDYERAVEAKMVTEFRRAIQRAARGVEGAISDGLGRVSKWFGGAKQPKAPTDVTPRPGAQPEPSTTPPPPTTPQPLARPPVPATPEPPKTEPPKAEPQPAEPPTRIEEPQPAESPPVEPPKVPRKSLKDLLREKGLKEPDVEAYRERAKSPGGANAKALRRFLADATPAQTQKLLKFLECDRLPVGWVEA